MKINIGGITPVCPEIQVARLDKMWNVQLRVDHVLVGPESPFKSSENVEIMSENV